MLSGMVFEVKEEQEEFDFIKSILYEYEKGSVTNDEMKAALAVIVGQYNVTVHQNPSDPFAPVSILHKAPSMNRPQGPKGTSNNPLAGKGNSYAEHVSGPDGWGQYVKPDKDSPF